jgi:hypothetical protein
MKNISPPERDHAHTGGEIKSTEGSWMTCSVIIKKNTSERNCHSSENREKNGQESTKFLLPREKQIVLTAPLLWIRIKGKIRWYEGLIDTGASINLISPKTLDGFEHYLLMKFETKIHGIDTTLKDLRDWNIVAMQFPSRDILYIPFLTGAPEQIGIIFGMPFIQQIKATIDIPAKLIQTKIGCFGWIEDIPITKINPRGQKVLMALESPSENEEEKLIFETFQKSILSEEGKKIIIEKLKELKQLWKNNTPGSVTGIDHEIVLTDQRPINLPPRAIPLTLQKEVDEEMEKMLQDNVISPSASPYCTYPVLRRKKTGELRITIDYRKLNEVTVSD